MARRTRSRTLVPLLALLAVASPRPAHAESSDSAAAQGLYDQAKALMAAGKWSEACPKLEESQRLDPGSGTLVNLARCYEQSGRTASAWSTYLEAAASAKGSGNTARESAARQRADALAPKVSKLVIDVPSTARVEGLEVKRDGKPVGAAQWGSPIPTDGGKHEITASAPGRSPWRTEVTLRDEGKSQTVSVPHLELVESPAAPAPAPAAAPSEPGSPPPAGPTPPAAEETKTSSGLGTQRIVALVAGGVGVVGLGVGGFFGIQALSHKKTADQNCEGPVCSNDEGVNAGEDAKSAATIATIAMTAGGVLVATGATLWFTAPSAEPTATVGLGLGRVVVRGTF